MIPAVRELGDRLRATGWVTELLVGGSLATGDYVPGVSDLDLVAVTDGPVDAAREHELVRLHRHLDGTLAAGLALGCVYVAGEHLADPALRHPTWTHGRLVHRILSGIARAELLRYGYPVFGRPPDALLAPMDADDLRRAARAELTGYWAWAARRPWMWLDPALADLGLTSMARGRHTLATGELLTKTAAVERAAAPPWLIAQLRARRRGEHAAAPRLRTGWLAWRDARRSVIAARRGTAQE